jgi:hypothetical protein
VPEGTLPIPVADAVYVNDFVVPPAPAAILPVPAVAPVPASDFTCAIAIALDHGQLPGRASNTLCNLPCFRIRYIAYLPGDRIAVVVSGRNSHPHDRTGRRLDIRPHNHAADRLPIQYSALNTLKSAALLGSALLISTVFFAVSMDSDTMPLSSETLMFAIYFTTS